MAPKYQIVLKTIASLAAGAISGALYDVLINAHGDLSKVDWHQAGDHALGVALIAVIAHYFPPPTTVSK